MDGSIKAANIWASDIGDQIQAMDSSIEAANIW